MSTRWRQSQWRAIAVPVAALAPDCALTPAHPQRPAQRVATAVPAVVTGRALHPVATAAPDAPGAPPAAGQPAVGRAGLPV